MYMLQPLRIGFYLKDRSELDILKKLLNGIPLSVWFRRKVHEDVQKYQILLESDSGRFIGLEDND